MIQLNTETKKDPPKHICIIFFIANGNGNSSGDGDVSGSSSGSNCSRTLKSHQNDIITLHRIATFVNRTKATSNRTCRWNVCSYVYLLYVCIRLQFTFFYSFYTFLMFLPILIENIFSVVSALCLVIHFICQCIV